MLMSKNIWLENVSNIYILCYNKKRRVLFDAPSFMRIRFINPTNEKFGYENFDLLFSQRYWLGKKLLKMNDEVDVF